MNNWISHHPSPSLAAYSKSFFNQFDINTSQPASNLNPNVPLLSMDQGDTTILILRTCFGRGYSYQASLHRVLGLKISYGIIRVQRDNQPKLKQPPHDLANLDLEVNNDPRIMKRHLYSSKE